LVTDALARGGRSGSEHLAEAFDDPGVGQTARAVAAETLGLIAALGATDALCSAAASPETDPNTRIAAIRALGRIGSPGALPVLLACLDEPDLPVRTAAAHALGAMGSPGAVTALAHLLDGPHGLARNAAASLAGLGEPGRKALELAAGTPGASAQAAAALAATRLASLARPLAIGAMTG
jgi:HEAT repeat protein